MKIKGGYEVAEKYPMPRDCEASIFDEEEDYVYICKTDTNGGRTMARYHLEEDPVPRFDPKKYVTIDDFTKFREEMLNGFNSLQQTIANNANNGYSKSIGAGKQSGKSNTIVNQSSGDI